MTNRKFTPRDDQVDFTHARYCPVINCVLEFGDKILLVKRSDKMNLYPGYWNGLSGFLDDKKSIEEKVAEELSEEVGLSKKNIQSIKQGDLLLQEAPEYGKTWIVFPILVEIDSDKVKLDWEASEHQWLDPAEAKKLKLLPGFEQVLASFF